MSSTDRLVAPLDRVTSPADLDELRSWSIAALARGAGTEALDALAVTSASGDLEAPRLGLISELSVRVGIATDDADLVTQALLPPPDEVLEGYESDSASMLARAVGAQWLAELAEREHGRSARFREGRPWIGLARWGLAHVLSACTLEPAQQAEAAAALRRVYSSAGRFTADELVRRAIEKAPRRLRPAREALRTARRRRAGAEERRFAILGALHVVAHECEPVWPATGGPWWISDALGLTIDVSEPRDDAGRHRFALADALMEFDDLPQFLPDDAGMTSERLWNHYLAIAEHALGHASLSGLAGS